MAKSKLVQANDKIAEVVVGGYKKIEDGVVEGFTKMTDKFVDQFLTKEGEEAKTRMAGEKTQEEKTDDQN